MTSCLRTTHLQSHPNLPVANELQTCSFLTFGIGDIYSWLFPPKLRYLPIVVHCCILRSYELTCIDFNRGMDT